MKNLASLRSQATVLEMWEERFHGHSLNRDFVCDLIMLIDYSKCEFVIFKKCMRNWFPNNCLKSLFTFSKLKCFNLFLCVKA